ncbi:hypothetical protein cyc_06450 [Cyclospora cayetanensis]|uniref:Uncharacterized protein n=1 Tax=Cyclospora cayetanensis TaxID=88456 RepID=A0A1D3CRK2_9EIME|nr:hypothetical protein cyc_06450 [Cyclospora cayetanensis]
MRGGRKEARGVDSQLVRVSEKTARRHMRERHRKHLRKRYTRKQGAPKYTSSRRAETLKAKNVRHSGCNTEARHRLPDERISFSVLPLHEHESPQRLLRLKGAKQREQRIRESRTSTQLLLLQQEAQLCTPAVPDAAADVTKPAATRFEALSLAKEGRRQALQALQALQRPLG